VALAVDQWNTAREDRNREARYIDRLRADLEWDTATFASFERERMTVKMEVLDALLADDAIDRLLARPNLVNDLSWSGFKALPANRPATFEELQSTGDLSLLQDLELRGALSRYYSGFDHISRILSEPDGDYRARLSSSISGQVMRDWRLSDTAPDMSVLRDDLEALVSSPGLQASVNSELSYAASMAFYLHDYLEQAVQLLESLDGS